MKSEQQTYLIKKKPIFRDQLVTVSDLETFKTELLIAIQALLGNSKKAEEKKWLKTYEVKRLLKISAGTLQTLRSNGTLPYSKIGGILYYNAEDIQKVMESSKKDFHSRFRSIYGDNNT